MHYFGVPMLWNISIGPKMTFGSVSEHFANLQHVTICKTCVPSLNKLFRGIEVVKHPFYLKWCLGVFRSISLTFDRWQDAKLVFWAWMHYFGVPRIWNISIGHKMMFGSVSEHFGNHQQVTRCKTFVPSLNTLFRGIEVAKHPFYSIWPNWCLGVCVRAWMHFLGVPKLWSIHSTPLDPNWCLWVFRRISLSFDR
jgi:hypothetical protein